MSYQVLIHPYLDVREGVEVPGMGGSAALALDPFLFSSTLLAQKAVTGTNQFLMKTLEVRRTKKINGLTVELSPSEYDARKIKRIKNIETCKDQGFYDYLFLYDHEKERVHRTRLGCNHPWCKHCMERKARDYRRKFKKIILDFKRPRFMTVGFKDVEVLTRDFLLKCSSEFNSWSHLLRRESKKKFLIRDRKKVLDGSGNPIKNPLYHAYLGRYISVLEIKFHQAGDFKYERKTKKVRGIYKKDSWNIHYHLVWDGSFIKQSVATELLLKATKGESYYMYFERIATDGIRNKLKATNYISKYISKMNFCCNDLKYLTQYYGSIHKIRFVKIIGTIKKPEDKRFELLTKFLYRLYEDIFDACKMYDDICKIMNQYDLPHFDPALSFDENFESFAPQHIKKDAVDSAICMVEVGV